MNFKDLAQRLKNIQEGTVDECGDMPIDSAPAHSGQADTVSMTVNMNGAGRDGIRDLMDILRNLENEQEQDSAVGITIVPPSADNTDPLFGDFDEPDHEQRLQDEYENSADNQDTHDFAAVINPPSNDMNRSKQASPLARAPGSNPLRSPANEALHRRLNDLYTEVKNR